MAHIDPPAEGAAWDCAVIVHGNALLLLRHVSPSAQALTRKALDSR